MAALQTVAFGAASDGSQGDSVRTGFTKVNANVAALQTQAALTTYTGGTITTAQALTKAHVGQRVNINLSTAGTVNLPSASTCGADNVLLLRNTGGTVVTLAVTAGSGDTCWLSRLNPGETALLDTDGVHTWSVLMRGRTNSDTEAFNARPTFAGNVPWDAGNLPSPVKSASNGITLTWVGGSGLRYAIDVTNQGYLVDTVYPAVIAGQKQFTATPRITVTPTGTYTAANLWLEGSGTSYAHFGLSGNNNSSAAQMRVNSIGGLEAVTWNAGAYTSFTASAFTVGSDAALKRDVVSLTGVMPKLRTKRSARYVLKSDDTAQLGVIAQEWLEDFPELVDTNGPEIDEDGDFIAHQYDEDGNEIYGPNGKPESRPALTFKYDNLAAVLLQGLLETDAALQSALARVAALEAKDSA